MFVPLKYFKGNFAEIAEELKKLADKLEKVQLYFMDTTPWLFDEEDTYFYAELVEGLQGAFEVVRNREFASCRPTLCIKSQK